MKCTWIGGPTVLLELGSFRVVTDPVLSTSIEIDGATVTRNVAVPEVSLDGVDAVCLSCARPDHLDVDSLRHFEDVAFVTSDAAADAPLALGSTDVSRLCWWENRRFEKDGEILTVTAVPAKPHATSTDNGYFLEHVAGDKRTATYYTGDSVYSNDIREIQRRLGHANILIQNIGAEKSGENRSADAKEAMQFVYRMQPNAIVATHHNTFPHYNESLSRFQEHLGRTIYDKRLRVLTEGESFQK